MKSQSSKQKIVIVLSNNDGSSQCPRLVLSEARASFRDDYRNRLPFPKKLLKSVSGI